MGLLINPLSLRNNGQLFIVLMMNKIKIIDYTLSLNKKYLLTKSIKIMNPTPYFIKK